MIDVYDNKDVLCVEAELLDELDDLERNYFSSSSSSSSLCSIERLSKDEDINNNETLLIDVGFKQSLDSTTGQSLDTRDLLSSIPGYELFKESLDVSSATCFATLQAVDSMNQLFGDNNDHIETCTQENGTVVQVEYLSSNTNRKELPSTTKPFVAKTDKEGSTKVNGELVRVQHLNGDENNNKSSTKVSKLVNDSDITSFHDTKQSDSRGDSNDKETEGIYLTTEVEKSVVSLPLVENLQFLTIVENEENHQSIAEKLQEQIEIEAKEEQNRQKRKRNRNKQKRTMDALKERDQCQIQNKSARYIQDSFREYRRRRKSRVMRGVQRGFLKLYYLRKYWTTKSLFLTWVICSTQIRAAIKIQTHIHIFIKRRRQKRMKLLKVMNNALKIMALRKSFFFWIVYTSTLKLQEKLMYEMKNGALAIQCGFRQYRAKCVFNRLKNDYHSTTIQKHVRSYWARKNFRIARENRIGRRFQAAVTIQKVYRGHMTRIRWDKAVSTNFSYIDKDIDNILGEEADFILDEIIWTMEDETSTNSWKPCKPIIKNTNTIHCAKNYDDDLNQVLTQQSDKKENPHSSGSGIRSEKRNLDEQSTSHEDSKLSTLNSCPTIEHTGTDLMKEWKISDHRVVESMMKRKARMNKGRRREKQMARLSNPANRFKKFMKNVCRREKAHRIAP